MGRMFGLAAFFAIAVAASAVTEASEVCAQQGACGVPARGAGLLQEKSSVRGAQKRATDDGEEDDEEEGEDEIAPLVCKEGERSAAPIQVLEVLPNGYEARVVDVESGLYEKEPLYNIPFDRTTPGFSHLNSCAVSPLTYIVYCTLKMIPRQVDGGGPAAFWIVRMDGDKIEFVGKLPWEHSFNSGTFHPSGKFYIAGGGKIVRIDNIDGLEGFPSSSFQLALQATSPFESLKDKWNKLGGVADLVAINADLDGEGEKDYILSVTTSRKLAVVTDNGSEEWTRKFITIEGIPSDAQGGFGAGWNFGGRVFFANNAGKGVYEINIGSIDLTTKPQKAVDAERVGGSQRTVKNDGMNCMNIGAPDPWEPEGWTTTTTTTATTTTTTTTSMVKCAPGYIRVFGREECHCGHTCRRCSTKRTCSNHASAVTVSPDGLHCLCSCEAGWQGPTCADKRPTGE